MGVWLLAVAHFMAHGQSLEERVQRLEMSMRETPRQALDLTWKPADPRSSNFNLGPTASKVYFHDQPVTLGISAEFLTFSERRGLDGTSKNLNRANVATIEPALAFQLGNQFVFNTQFLFENGGAESSDTVTLRKGQSVLKMAYLDWLISADVKMGVRVGHQLVPMGLTNTSSESLTYFGVLKPELEREIVPSNWHENGVTYWLYTERADFEFGIFNSLNASGLKGETFLSGGRANGQNAAVENPMAVTRVRWRENFFTMGGSLAAGRTDQGTESYRNGTFALWDLNLHFDQDRVRSYFQYAAGKLLDADAISAVNGTVMGEAAKGFAMEVAYQAFTSLRHSTWIFARYSKYDLHDQVPKGLTRDHTYNKSIVTLGLQYLPTPNIVFKVDHQFRRNEAADEDDEFNVGAGLSF
ncbi:MAG: hypothetical protein AB7F86_13440 [Bdellovibrionales bacterium]